jgi:hypothetical protein
MRLYYILVGKPTKVDHNAGCVCLACHDGYQPFSDD